MLIAGIISIAWATTAVAAGQGLSDTIAHCEAPSGAQSRVADLDRAIARAQAPAEQHRLFIERGRANNANCAFTAALADFERALRAKPASIALASDFYIGRGDAHLRLQERDLALADYHAALHLIPNVEDQAHIFQMRGYVHSDKGEETQAIADFTQLIRLKPDYTEAYWLRAVSYENLNDYASALKDYDQLARLKPNDWTAWSQVCWGHAYWNSGLEEGLMACDKSLMLNPDDANTLDARGFVNFRLGRFVDAVADYDHALRLEPALPGSLFLRGLAQLRLGYAIEGDSDVRAAQMLEPGIAQRFAGYGVIP